MQIVIQFNSCSDLLLSVSIMLASGSVGTMLREMYSSFRVCVLCRHLIHHKVYPEGRETPNQYAFIVL